MKVLIYSCIRMGPLSK